VLIWDEGSPSRGIPTVSGQSCWSLDAGGDVASSSWVSWVFAELCAIRAKIRRIRKYNLSIPITSSLIYYLPDVGPEGKYACNHSPFFAYPFAIVDHGAGFS